MHWAAWAPQVSVKPVNPNVIPAWSDSVHKAYCDVHAQILTLLQIVHGADPSTSEQSGKDGKLL